MGRFAAANRMSPFYCDRFSLRTFCYADVLSEQFPGLRPIFLLSRCCYYIYLCKSTKNMCNWIEQFLRCDIRPLIQCASDFDILWKPKKLYQLSLVVLLQNSYNLIHSSFLLTLLKVFRATDLCHTISVISTGIFM